MNRKRSRQVEERRRIQKLQIYLLTLSALVIVLMFSIFNQLKSKENNQSEYDRLENLELGIDIENKEEKESNENKKGKLIVVDAGHGNDTGCTFGGVLEDDVNINISKKVQVLLEKEGYDVIMTREDDKSKYTIRERAELANDNNADLYISIHCNSESDHTTGAGTVEGIETWYNDIKDTESVVLANHIQNELIKTTKSFDLGTKIENEFVVIRDTKMPACLVECGYISNKKERKMLATDSYQDKLAQGIVAGIYKYLENKKE